MIVMVMLLMVTMYSSPVTPITVKMLAATAAKIVVGLLINIGLIIIIGLTHHYHRQDES